MKFLNSVVTKLWLTIILMVTAVLIILTIILSFYFRSYVLNSTEATLEEENNHTEEVLLAEHDLNDLTHPHLLQEDNLIIFSDDGYLTSDNTIERQITERVDESADDASTMILEDVDGNDYMVTVSYMDDYFEESPMIINYRDLEAMNESVTGVTVITIISGIIIFLLTTFFAFFLISRITRPLINLKQAAFKTAQGNYNKLNVLSRDEIGELTLAFNKMNDDISENIDIVTHERNLREQIFNSMNEGVLYFDQEQELKYSNEIGSEILEKLKDYPNEMSILIENINDMATESTSVIEHIELNNQHLQLSYTPVKTNYTTFGVVILIRDITQDVNSEKMRSEFISNVSHELKTPMVMLSGYSEALLDDVVTDPDEMKEMVSIIKDESDRMNKMVNELIGLAKMEADSNLINKEVYDIITLINRISTKFKHDLKENDVQLNLSFDKDEIQFLFDYDKLENVINNLLDNAIRYTTPGSEITISAEDRSSHVVVKIEDTGTGIRPEHQERIFERFYKVDESRTRGKHGTGLGLYIVKNIIERHGGTIDLTSEFGSGSKFTITLPK